MTELNTNAEKSADGTRKIPGFKNFSLPGVKEKVAAMLGLIGRDGIFSTYTAHDISHIDSMLSMLEWLIPDRTRQAMTSADWLMIVLAIYFHDLGMVVPAEEFENRCDDLAYRQFREALDSDPDATDYIARAQEMDDQERERFFFQEFIREQHPRRTRQWITGRGPAKWGTDISPIADEVGRLLADLPSRFREHLGIICESHHSDDIEDRQRYPIFERYANHKEAGVNVQYAAIILRTADLIHVTQDRTPSINYRVLRLSDPNSVAEWRKHQGTFAVGMKTRKFDPNDADSHVITISADFTEESPFFSLTEYIVYADGQLKQSKRWADKSQLDSDATDFSFPWHTFEGKVLVEGNEPVRMKFELDRGRLLDLLVGHTIYNDPTVAVRELLQNAIDAVRYQSYRDSWTASERDQPTPMGNVEVRWNPQNRALVVEDDGIGMDLDTIKFHLMRVGSSFYDTDQFKAENSGFSAISRFGIGVLTCFMVSDDIEVITQKSGRAHRLRMRSVHADYLLKELEPDAAVLDGLAAHGTRVTLKVRPSADLETRSVEDILRYWVILPECRVSFREAGMDARAVGFRDIKDAVRKLYDVPAGDDDRSRFRTFRILSEREHIESTNGEPMQQYEIGFATSKGYTPEWNFMYPENRKQARDQAAVCVEGIRVDSRMPGFVDNGVVGILSVRGNRNFRTTVSRTNLEQDAEYLRVGSICLRLLFEHVGNEISRIARNSGEPMSQASSAGRWLVGRLRACLSTEGLTEELDDRYANVPTVVVEESDEQNGDLRTERSFISRKSLGDRTSFWTIESRMVDSLGTISRDLGRELALNDFLRALAPELCDPRISPVVVDAHQIEVPLTATHHPTKVEFSKRHQQTAVFWELGRSWSFENLHPIADGLIRDETSRSEWLDEALQVILKFAPSGHAAPSLDQLLAVLSWDRSWRIEPVTVDGDVDDINLIKTRVVKLVSSESRLGKVLRNIRSLIDDLHVGRAESNKLKILILFMCLLQRLSDAPGEFLGDGREDRSPLESLWRMLAGTIVQAFGETASEHIEANRDPSALARQVNIFDVSVYWRDWAKADSQ